MRKPRPTVELLARWLPRALFLRVYGLAKTGRWPDLRTPTRFSDRLLRRMLDPGDELATMVRTGDKYTMRDYVTERLGEGHLPRLIDVIEAGETITGQRMASWPATAVMKASHASRWMTFVERDTADPAELDALARSWLSRRYGAVRQEPHYDLMTPRVVVEEDLRRDGIVPSDVKFFVIHGEPRFVVVDFDRFGRVGRTLFDPSWQRLEVRYVFPPIERDPPVPVSLPIMIGIARTLATGLAFVRVDLYEVEDRILVGEMTHFPSAGAPRFDPRSFDDELGAVWRDRRPIDPHWLRSDQRGMAVVGQGRPRSEEPDGSRSC